VNDFRCGASGSVQRAEFKRVFEKRRGRQIARSETELGTKQQSLLATWNSTNGRCEPRPGSYAPGLLGLAGQTPVSPAKPEPSRPAPNKNNQGVGIRGRPKSRLALFTMSSATRPNVLIAARGLDQVARRREREVEPVTSMRSAAA